MDKTKLYYGDKKRYENFLKRERMKILAIDPGPVESAFLVLENGRPAKFNKIGNSTVLMMLRLGEIQFDRFAIEMIASYGMAVGKEVFETCLWIGRFVEAADGEAEYIYRKDVKLHLCGNPRAKDSNIRQALIDRFGPPGTKKNPGVTYGISNDVWSALAIAVTSYDRLKESPTRIPEEAIPRT